MASKYIRGERITSLDTMYAQDFIYMNHKVYCRGWFSGWHISCANSWICQGIIYKAVHKDEKEK